MFFYNQNSQEITQDEWVNLFEPYYFLNGHTHGHRITRKNQGSRFVENQIEFILEKGLSINDLPLIVAWKIGAIDHQASENQRVIVFKNHFNQDFRFQAQYGTIRAAEIITYCQQNFNNLTEINTDAEQLFSNFYENRGGNNRFGLVSCLSLLYFFTQGMWPIYDRYAHIALNAISLNIPPGKCVPCEPINQFNDYREWYVNKLIDIFGNQNILRKIDRSLWVYGHFFPST